MRAAVDAGRGNMYTAACENGNVLSAEFMTAEEFASAAADGALFLTSPEKGTAAALLAVASDKAERGEFVSAFEPYYMRKPQAERGTE